MDLEAEIVYNPLSIGTLIHGTKEKGINSMYEGKNNQHGMSDI